MTYTGETIPSGGPPRAAEIELNSIQPIPDGERHGTVGQQWRLWYACNANFFCVVLGSFAVLLGLNLFWAIAAIVIGSVIGGILTGLHAVQGPRLGVPQMIQSRGQFGFYFGVVLFLMGILLDVGYMGGGVVVGAQSLQGVIPGLPIQAWIVIFAVPCVVLAIWGYRLIHAVQPYLVVIMTGVWFAILGLIIASGDHLAKGMGGTHLASFPVFLVVVGLFFMNQLSWAIYVSDYSRYMPRDTSGPRIVTAVTVGSTVSTVAFCALGAWVTAISPTAASPVTVIANVAGKWVLWFSALSLVAGAAMNAYTGMLSWESVRSTWQQVKLSRLTRVVGVLLISAVALVLALLGWRSFVTTFSNFLSVLLFVFVPWSLINLVDFYLVQHERYDIASFYTPRGSYGGWRWVAVIPYLVAVGAELLFVDQTDLKGPLVNALGGADISWIVGGVVAAAGYLIAVRIAGRGAEVPVEELTRAGLSRRRGTPRRPACRRDQLVPGVDAQLGVDVFQVGLDGADRQGQLPGDVGVRGPGGGQGGHPLFLGAQRA
jgi:NCS1 family nucleobase:cation symporter-1